VTIALEYFSQVMRVDNPSILIDELMKQYGQDVWNYAFVMTKRKELADDISQDVFLKAYQHLSRFEWRSAPRTWLLTITRNTALNYMKSVYARRVTLMEFIEHHVFGRSAEAEWIDRENTNILWTYVMELPAKYREVLLLDAHYELSGSEMAALLGVPEGTVKSRLSRARAKVEAKWKGGELE
jgi:RNA polymerase sigma-70 factor (ECF subfamily)